MPAQVMPDLQRPQHKRNQSSKSTMLRALLGSEPATVKSNNVRTRSTTIVLGERAGNAQSPPASPATRNMSKKTSTTKQTPQERKLGLRKSKSTMNLTSVPGAGTQLHKSTISPAIRDDKENEKPPQTSHEQSAPPIWAQFATTQKSSVEEEIARYTPHDYHPGTQRNFNGDLRTPSLRPTLAQTGRPQSAYLLNSEGIYNAIGRRVSSARSSLDNRSSEDSGRRVRQQEGRKVSGSSTEQGPHKDKLTIAKRGGRVMAAVAALQGRSKATPVPARQPDLDPSHVDEAFEKVLEARNIPEPQRQKMRALTLRVKADFIRQDQGVADVSGTMAARPGTAQVRTDSKGSHVEVVPVVEEDEKSMKRTRPRSRTFTFSKGDKHGDRSPTKKARALSRGALGPITTKESGKTGDLVSTPATPNGSLGRRNAPPSYPADYIAYLRSARDPTKTEIGKMHKLRLLLRNETIAWVDSFIALGGMSDIIDFLDRIMAVEWREEHEDQLLHETLLCLKGLCTTERAMAELEKYADTLFPKLVGMLFDEEKKGPAEYATRTIIINILFNFLTSATTHLNAPDLDKHARRILGYLGEQAKPEDVRPIDFVLEMRVPRPYKLWCREASNVSKEVFWIFLHQLNIISLPKATDSLTDVEESSPAPRPTSSQMTAFAAKHFPGSRPPVPAAPYIGGVEWDATTYLAAHLDLLNGLVASIETKTGRNALREELRASGFEKLMGGTLRTCKEKFYSCVHDGLRAWVASATEDGWETKPVREGPSEDEASKKSPAKAKHDDLASPRIEALPVLPSPQLDLGEHWDWRE